MGDGHRMESERVRGEEWVVRLRAGDQTAFPEIYDDFFPKVHAFIRRRLNESAEAQDLTQETLVQVFRSLDRFEGRSSLLSWTFGIAHNGCSRYFRTRSRWMVDLRDASAVGDPSFDPRLDRRLDAARILDRCMLVLDSRREPAHREIFRLRYSEHQSLLSIAETLGQSSKSVKASLKRSRSVLSASVPDLRRVLDEVARIA